MNESDGGRPCGEARLECGPALLRLRRRLGGNLGGRAEAGREGRGRGDMAQDGGEGGADEARELVEA